MNYKNHRSNGIIITKTAQSKREHKVLTSDKSQKNKWKDNTDHPELTEDLNGLGMILFFKNHFFTFPRVRY